MTIEDEGGNFLVLSLVQSRHNEGGKWEGFVTSGHGEQVLYIAVGNYFPPDVIFHL